MLPERGGPMLEHIAPVSHISVLVVVMGPGPTHLHGRADSRHDGHPFMSAFGLILRHLPSATTATLVSQTPPGLSPGSLAPHV